LLQHTWRSADQRQCHRSELTQKPKRWTVPAMKKTLLGGETTVVPILFVGNIYVCVSILYIYMGDISFVRRFISPLSCWSC
jgi:hypothetical protein